VWNAWAPSSLSEHAKFELPETVAGWEKTSKAAMMVERPQTEAATSFVWQYHRGDVIASVAVDYPFTGYHELTYCYGSTGWNIRSEITAKDSTGDFQQVEMTKYPDQSGYLLFGISDEQARSVTPVAGFSSWSLRNSLAAYRSFALGGPTYQVQVVVQQYSALTPKQRAEIDELFRQARQMLVSQLQSQMGKP
jgi:hypothetical protein